MRYLLLIADDESTRTAIAAEDDAATLNEYGEWVKTMADRGVLQGGERLRPASDATTVRVRNAEVLSPTAPSPRPRSSWVAISSWTARTWTRRLRSPRRFPARAPAASR